MKFVTTSQGFYVSESYNREFNRKEYVFSHSLREAFIFNKKRSAQNKVDNLKKKGINAFIFCPISEEPCRDLYEVKSPEPRENNFWGVSKEEQRRRSVYHIDKVIMCSYSDIDFVKGVKHPTERYLTYDKALEKCKEKNEELIDAIMDVGRFNDTN